jgi:hypothetical protein
VNVDAKRAVRASGGGGCNALKAVSVAGRRTLVSSPRGCSARSSSCFESVAGGILDSTYSLDFIAVMLESRDTLQDLWIVAGDDDRRAVLGSELSRRAERER